MNDTSPASAAAPSCESPSGRATVGTAVLLLVVLLAGGPPRGSSIDPKFRPPEFALRLDPNTATREELMLLPGVGPALAEYIVAYREQSAVKPAFRRAEDLDHVHRIGPATVAKLRPYLTFDGGLGNVDPNPKVEDHRLETGASSSRRATHSP